MDRSVRLARDAFFVTVGFGVIVIQKAQVRRRELAQHLDAGAVDAAVAHLEHQVDGVLDPLTHLLPGPARHLVEGARDAARGAGHQIVGMIVPGAGGSSS